jgi:hypothetical protein
VSRRNGGDGKVLVNSLLPVGDDAGPTWREIHVTIDLDSMGEDRVDDLKRMLSGSVGDARVFFHVRENGRRAYVIRARNQGVKVDPALLSGLAASVGPANVRLVAAGMGA